MCGGVTADDLYVWVTERWRRLFPELGPMTLADIITDASGEEADKLSNRARAFGRVDQPSTKSSTGASESARVAGNPVRSLQVTPRIERAAVSSGVSRPSVNVSYTEERSVSWSGSDRPHSISRHMAVSSVSRAPMAPAPRIADR